MFFALNPQKFTARAGVDWLAVDGAIFMSFLLFRF
jgi:hypothetical protein